MFQNPQLSEQSTKMDGLIIDVEWYVANPDSQCRYGRRSMSQHGVDPIERGETGGRLWHTAKRKDPTISRSIS